MGDADALLLHRLWVRGPATGGLLARQSALSQPEVDAALDALAGEDLVRQLAGGRGTWGITGSGRDRHRATMRAELEVGGAGEQLAVCYRHFRPLNTEFLQVCTRFQLRPTPAGDVVNDHGDRLYDATVIRALRDIDERIQPELAVMAREIGRFSSYGLRFTTALARLESGDTQWFASPGVESYHSVWFELHEDLLVTLGLEREREEVAP